MAEASEVPAPVASQDVQPRTEQPAVGSGEAPANDGQVTADTTTAESGMTTSTPPQWCKYFCEPNERGQQYYFLNAATGESTWDEPCEDFWLFDYKTWTYHVSGLQKPTPREKLIEEQIIRNNDTAPLPYDEKTPENGWQGYNPRVHGPWNKDAAYNAWHTYTAWKEANPQGVVQQQQQPQAHGNETYDSVAGFNAHTGQYQNGEQSADRHNAANRAGRQMNAFFDVDSAANSHDGRSLKEERRNQKLSKKEVAEMNKKRKDKKDAKRLAFYKS